MEPKFQISLKAARINAELKQKEVAEKLGVDTSTIGSWEKGESQPNITMGNKLANLYGLPLENIKFSHPKSPLKSETNSDLAQ